MILCIDAYNVLKQFFGNVLIKEPAREVFLRRLSCYAQRKGHKIIVVFDGGPYDRITQFKERFLTVVYSGSHDTADDSIKKILLYSPSDSTVLVSTDRILCAYVAHFGITSIDSMVFYDMLCASEREHVQARVVGEVTQLRIVRLKDQALKRPGHTSSVEIDTLMAQASSSIMYKDGNAPVLEERVKKPITLSKKEKRLLKVVSKL